MLSDIIRDHPSMRASYNEAIIDTAIADGLKKAADRIYQRNK